MNNSKTTNVFNKPEEANPLAGISIDDVMICPECGSDNCYPWDTDTIVFNGDNTGRYYEDCACRDCKAHFRLYTTFKYELTSARTHGG